jgi:phosphatidylserine decarboxylase
MGGPREYKPIVYKIYGDSLSVRFLYNTLPGRILLRVLVKPAVSMFFGFMMDRGVSRVFIPGFIKRNYIDLDEYENEKYISFNSFFTRKVKEGARPLPTNASDVFAPCDGKLTAYPIAEDSVFCIKNTVYSVESLLGDKTLASGFINGICLIFRLTPDDYHRYCYIDDGEVLASKTIKGVLHTVRPIALKRYNIYAQNAREYAVLQTKNFGKVIQLEVGALFVGRIVNHKTNGPFQRGEEKGMFAFGGSTVVMLFEEGAVEIDGAIIESTRQNSETVVRMGVKIGEKSTRGKEKTP